MISVIKSKVSKQVIGLTSVGVTPIKADSAETSWISLSTSDFAVKT